MQYLMLIQIDEERFAAHDDSPMMSAQAVWSRSLTRRGAHLVSDRLRPPDTARTVRRSGGRAMWIDGPFVETKEHLGGYYLVALDALDEAVKLAESMPVRAHCPVFVAPVEKATVLPREGAHPGKQTLMIFYGPPPRVAPVHGDLRAWIRLPPEATPVAIDPETRPPQAPVALALVDGGLEGAQALAEITVPEGGAVELRPVVVR